MAAENDRQRAEDHYYAALDLVAEGEQERALAEYQLSLAADPDFTEAMHGLARALQDLDRLDEAIAVGKRITELDADDVLAYTSFSVLYRKKAWFRRPKRRRTRLGCWDGNSSKKETVESRLDDGSPTYLHGRRPDD